MLEVHRTYNKCLKQTKLKQRNIPNYHCSQLKQNHRMSLPTQQPELPFVFNQQVVPNFPPIPSHKQPMPRLKLCAKTWNKDSYGLFDYQAEERSYEKLEYRIVEGCWIARENRTCRTVVVKDIADLIDKKDEKQDTEGRTNSFDRRRSILPSQFGLNLKFTILAEVLVEHNSKGQPLYKLKFHQQPFESQQNNQKQPPLFTFAEQIQNSKRLTPFLLARPSNEECHGIPLKSGNKLKFGRVQYLVLESFNGKTKQSYRDSFYLQDEGQEVFDVVKSQQQKNLNKTVQSDQKEQEIMCKVCLCNEQSPEDPLISPCKCKGYCGLIHMNCLRMWINNKVKKEISGLAVSYNFTKFECEICKSPFPKIVRTETEQVQMMTLQKPLDKPYIMLESLDHMSSHSSTSLTKQKEKLLHLISTDEKEPIKIGRANECQIRLMDISVSRRHAEIKLVQGEFYIKDTDAKFGTLVQVGQSANSIRSVQRLQQIGQNSKQKQSEIINITRKNPIKIQLGRTLYQFSIQLANEEVQTQ